MNNQTEKEVYLVDTSFLLDFALWIPLDLNNYFWSHLQTALKNGTWILLDVVMNEIRSKGPLKSWCENQKRNGLVIAISESDKNRGVAINNTYPMIDQATGRSETDTYLIAYAEANGLTVVSRESYRENNTELHKIPDVCAALKISLIRQPRAFLERIGFCN